MIEKHWHMQYEFPPKESMICNVKERQRAAVRLFSIPNLTCPLLNVSSEWIFSSAAGIVTDWRTLLIALSILLSWKSMSQLPTHYIHHLSSNSLGIFFFFIFFSSCSALPCLSPFLPSSSPSSTLYYLPYLFFFISFLTGLDIYFSNSKPKTIKNIHK